MNEELLQFVMRLYVININMTLLREFREVSLSQSVCSELCRGQEREAVIRRSDSRIRSVEFVKIEWFQVTVVCYHIKKECE